VATTTTASTRSRAQVEGRRARAFDLCVALVERDDEDEPMRASTRALSLSPPAPIQ